MTAEKSKNNKAPLDKLRVLDIATFIAAPFCGVIPVSYNTSDAADEEDSVDLGGRRIIKKKKKNKLICTVSVSYTQIKHQHKKIN